MNRLIDQITEIDVKGYPETQHCPEHGEQVVVSERVTKDRMDPYVIQRLACGHEVIAMGGDIEDIHIVQPMRARPKYRPGEGRSER